MTDVLPRNIPCTEPAGIAVPGDAGPGGLGSLPPVDGRNCRWVHPGKAETEALAILHSRGYRVGRISDGNPPRLIAALRNNRVLFVLAVRARYRVRNARDLSEKFPVETGFLRRAARGDAFRKQLWVLVPRTGWQVFEILPGGSMEVRDG